MIDANPFNRVAIAKGNVRLRVSWKGTQYGRGEDFTLWDEPDSQDR